MNAQIIDFTQLRKGTKTSRFRRIDVCPKCGKKGERIERDNAKSGRSFDEFTHRGHVSMGGLFFTVDEWCSVEVPFRSAGVR